MAIRWPHPIRIYRVEVAREHDLSLAFTDSDIYGEDKWARLSEEENAILDVTGPAEFTVLGTPARIYAPSNLDIQVGYYVQVKRPLVVDGKRSACASFLSATAAVDAASLPVVNPNWFKVGDQILVSGTAGHELTIVSSVGETALTLYSSHPLLYTYAAGDEVVACHFYRVTGRIAPQYTSPVQVLSLMEILGTKGLD